MSVESQLLDILREDKRTIIAELMSDDMKKDILQHEMQRLEELVPFINEGMNEAFKEEKAIIVVIDNNKKVERKVEYNEDNNASFTLRTESGKIIGETITDEEELEELKNDPNAFFLSDNFVTYNNLATPGEKQFFVIGSANSSFFTDENLEDLVSSLKVAIPSTITDHFIKDCFELPHDEAIGTLVIGFTE